MRVALSGWLLVVAVCTAPAEPLTRGERDRAMSHLHATRKLFLDSIAGLTEAQWSFKPAPDRWSIAECAEHIAVSEDMLFLLVTAKILKSPPAAERKSGPSDKDELVLRSTADRSRKVETADFLRPKGRWPTREALVAQFKQSRDRTIAFVEATAEDLRAHSAPNPVYQSLDAYQYILLMAGHTERHVAQINEVKADPNYPK